MHTFFASKKNKNVGVTLTPHSAPTWPPVLIAMSTFTNAIRPAALPCVLSCASCSNTGSIILHGPHVADVKNTTAARCVWSSPCNVDEFEHMWIGAATVDAPGFAVRGADADAGRDVGAESEPVA